MAGTLNLAYSALVVLVAVAGIAFVFFATGNDDDEETSWTGVAIALVVAAFLGVMVAGLVM